MAIMAIMTIMAIMALLYPNKVTCFLKHFHSCRSGPERSCFHVEEGVLRPTQVPWSIELWLHPIRPIGFGILPHRRSSCLRLVIHLDSLRVVASVAQMAHMLLPQVAEICRNIQELKSMFILGSTIPAISAAYSYFLMLSHIPDLTVDTCQNHPKPMRFYCLFVDRLWTEWYPLVPVAALCVFLLTSLRLGRIGSTVPPSAGMKHQWAIDGHRWCHGI